MILMNEHATAEAMRPRLSIMRHRLIAPAAIIATVLVGSVAAAQQGATTARLLEQFKNTTVFWQQFEIAKELAKVGDAQALAALEPLLRDDDRHVRANAAFVFAGRGDVRGLETLRAILADRSDRPLGQGIPGAINTAAPRLWMPSQIRADRYYAVHVLGVLRDLAEWTSSFRYSETRRSAITPRGPWARSVTLGPSDH